jgi:hypothetical protein
MRLPNCDKAIVSREKVVSYLLSHTHKDGKAKAAFFESFGFRADKWEILAAALKRHASENEIDHTETSPFGVRYIIIGECVAPDGRRPEIKAVWFIDEGEAFPRLVTAYPAKRA